MSNRRAVLGRIKSSGQMGRAEIARGLGLSTQAVSNIIAELEADGFLAAAGARSAGRGLPAVQYRINPRGGFALGAEIRPDALFAAIVDLDGEPVVTCRRKLADTAPPALAARLLALRGDMLTRADIPVERLLGAGIVMPGPFGETGISGLGSDLDGWQARDARALFTGALDMQVEVSNDANAAAMAERIGGVAQGVDHFAFLYFGAGLGLGLIDRGALVTGGFGNAGEIGHVPVATASGPQPLEALISRVSVQAHLGGDAPVTVTSLDRLYRAGDRALMAWLDQASAALGQALAVIENLFDPQTIILGGAMPAVLLDHLVAETPLPTRSVARRGDNPLPRLQRGASGRMTATLGAAALALNTAYTPHVAAL